MVLTRDFGKLVQKRVAKDPAFRDALLCEGVDTLLTGDVDTGKAVLCDESIQNPGVLARCA